MQVTERMLRSTAMMMKNNGQGRWALAGTAFTVVESIFRVPEAIYAVSNRHVSELAKESNDSGHVHLALFRESHASLVERGVRGPTQMLAMPGSLWVESSRPVDLAVARMPSPNEWTQAIAPYHQMFWELDHMADRRWLIESQVWEGEEVVSIGYPEERDWGEEFAGLGPVWPSVRCGHIARIHGWLDETEDCIVADMGAQKGQSGSPVFVRDRKGPKDSQFRLLGVAYAHWGGDPHLQYIEPAEKLFPLVEQAWNAYREWSYKK